VDVVTSADLVIDDAAWRRVSEDLIRKYTVLPLKIQGKELTLAMADPFNIVAIDDLRFATGCSRIKVVLAAERTLEAIIQERLKSPGLLKDILDNGELYRKALEMIDQNQVPDLPPEDVVEEPLSAHTIEVESESPPIISLVNFIFIEAFNRKASDIHVEPYQTVLRIRYRIDGVLYTILTPPPRLSMYIISRIKIMSGMDIAKRMVAQDGHLALKIKGENIHFRVSTLPTVYGEKCVLRLIRKQKMLEDVDALGFSPEVLARYKRVIRAAQGMVLFTGPTGSGKTTTLYASLNQINSPDINVVTLEDPVESTLYGINHVQIRHGFGLEFEDGLRAILRQDPDVIFVGEIRDGVVAEIAMQSAMTGHLVFSTLHANSTAETFERLADMGAEPFLISSTVLAVVAQRLLRRICPDCKAPQAPTPEEIEEFGLDAAYLPRGRHLPQGPGLPPVHEHRLPGPDRGLRGAVHDARAAGAREAAGRGRRAAEGLRGVRGPHHARGRPRQGALGYHHLPGGAPGPGFRAGYGVGGTAGYSPHAHRPAPAQRPPRRSRGQRPRPGGGLRRRRGRRGRSGAHAGAGHPGLPRGGPALGARPAPPGGGRIPAPGGPGRRGAAGLRDGPPGALGPSLERTLVVRARRAPPGHPEARPAQLRRVRREPLLRAGSRAPAPP
jgi:type IV pilus assembly protein PilB